MLMRRKGGEHSRGVSKRIRVPRRSTRRRSSVPVKGRLDTLRCTGMVSCAASAQCPPLAQSPWQMCPIRFHAEGRQEASPGALPIARGPSRNTTQTRGGWGAGELASDVLRSSAHHMGQPVCMDPISRLRPHARRDVSRSHTQHCHTWLPLFDIGLGALLSACRRT